MRLPRWMHRVYANALGYFWLPCSLCGRPTGGHEWKLPNQSIPTGEPGCSRGVCRACAGRPETLEPLNLGPPRPSG